MDFVQLKARELRHVQTSSTLQMKIHLNGRNDRDRLTILHAGLESPPFDGLGGFLIQTQAEPAHDLEVLRAPLLIQIEPALVSRPGRIDQAIEFPLPDEEGRAKLTNLYARGLNISEDLTRLIVSRTKGVSTAFIKELMRRCAQFQIEFSRGDVLAQPAVDAALEEMLFAGGALNRRLLGGEGVDQTAN